MRSAEPRAASELPAPPSPLWKAPDPPDPEAVARLARELSLSEVLCSLLVVRGYSEIDQAKSFLRPHLENMSDPLGLAGMAAAVERIERALDDGEGILVHGDYDADGIAGTALLTRWLRALGAKVRGWVPDRGRDGYDLGPAGLAAAEEAGASLIVTVDCGIRAHDAVDLARERNLDVIVTDHHAPGDTLPRAVAVVDPNRDDCPSDAGVLSGTGVVYRLCQALASARGVSDESLHPHLDLVALATVADLVPMRGENRILARFGLKAFRRTTKPGLTALMEVADVEPAQVDVGALGFALAPRINAAGRVGRSSSALRLLLTEDPVEARSLAAELDDANRRRRTEDRRIEAEALEILASTYDPDSDYGVVLASEGWHPGVIGIVASRIVERIHRPVVLVALDGSEGRGSARSIPGYHLADALGRCGGSLERFGGHAMAAGMDISSNRLTEFREAFAADARDRLADQELRPRLRIDAEVALGEATDELHRMLEYFGPFGIGNPRPVFVARGVRSAGSARKVGKGHLKLTMEPDGPGRPDSGGVDARLEAIGFGIADRLPPEKVEDCPFDVAFQLRENVYRGRRTLQARILDIRCGETAGVGEGP